MSLLEAKGLWREFHQPAQAVVALHDVDLAVGEGEFLTITGESGAGKSTLLALLAGLDRPTRGTVRFDGEALEGAGPARLAAIRRRAMGFVFQDFRLIRHLPVVDNVRLPLLFAPSPGGEERAQGLIRRFGLEARRGHRPDALSRGEMQRTALARALVHRPRLLFADEPTANLDRRNRDAIWKLFAELNRDEGLTVVVATHDPAWAPGDGRRVRLEDGRIAGEGS